MKRLFSGRRGVSVLLAGLGAVVLTGMALAAIPDSDGIIRGCYAKSGDLRVVDELASCDKHETPLNWNQQGDQGETGPQGPPGPVDAFASEGDATSVESESGSHRVASESVPAGSYVLTAAVVAFAQGTTGERFPLVSCFLRQAEGSGTIAEAFASVARTSALSFDFVGRASLGLTAAYTTADPTTPQVDCAQSGADAASFHADMTIVKVGSVG